ncbi:hypothetical protein ACPCIU_15715 [Streptomyces seoulensis]|uniref:hypothetical protein n=1 Tax=Streptomyces seoulensis TaxID=73044 RepID=UPI003C3049B1
MNARKPAPTGLPLVLIWVGIVLAVAGPVAVSLTGHTLLTSVAVVGFLVQLAGWMLHSRKGGAA